MKDSTQKIYGNDLAEKFDRYYKKSIEEDWFPDYSKNGWKMGFLQATMVPTGERLVALGENSI